MPGRPTGSPRGAGPAIDLLLVRRPGAPKRPARATIKQLFQRAWSAASARRRPRLGGRGLAVDVIVLGDAEIARLNRKHRGRTGPTDVLSFPLGLFDPERQAYHLGEIILSHETARIEARARRLPLSNELARYAVHGFLHLLRYEDDRPRKRSAMERLQEAVLAGTATRR